MANQYDVKSGNIKRQRGLVEALVEQGLTPSQGKMVGQVYVGPGLLDAISKPLLAAGGMYASGKLDDEESANSSARQAGLVEALTRLQNEPGTPGFTTEALGSEFPELQGAGMKNLEAQLSPKNVEKFLAPVMDAEGNLVQFSNRANQVNTGVKGYNKPSFGAPKVIVGADGTNQYQVTDDAGNTKVLPGEAYVRPPTQINNNLPAQETALQKKLGANEGDMIQAARDKRLAAQRTFKMAERLEALDKDGILSGPTAKPAQFAAQLASGLGITLRPEFAKLVSNSENFDQTVGKELTDMILNSSAGRGFTDTDREYVLKSFPGLFQTPAGRKEGFKFLKDASVRGSKEGKEIEDAIRSGTFQNIDLTDGAMQRYQQGQPSQQAPQPTGGIKFLGFE